MPSIEEILAYLAKEWAVLRSAPVAFVVLAGVSVAIGYLVGAWYYSGRVADTDARVALRDDQIKKLDEDVKRKDAEITTLKGAVQASGFVESWGSNPARGCYAVLNGAVSSLRQLATAYNAILVCGVYRQGVDRVTDTAVSISPATTIDLSSFRMDAAFSQQTREALLEAARARGEDTTQPAHVTASAWFEIAVVPKGVDAANLRSLQDVERFGGKRLGNTAATIDVPVP